MKRKGRFVNFGKSFFSVFDTFYSHSDKQLRKSSLKADTFYPKFLAKVDLYNCMLLCHMQVSE